MPPTAQPQATTAGGGRPASNGGHHQTKQKITTTAPTMIPLLRVLLLIGLVATLAVVAYGSAGLGLIPLDTAVFALGVGLATVSVVLLGLLISLRGNQKVAHKILEQEVQEMQPAPEPVAVRAAPAKPTTTPNPRNVEPVQRVFPRIDPHNHIVRIRDLDDDSAVALNRVGVYTIGELRDRDPTALAIRAGLPIERVEQWHAEANLMRVPGIGPEEAAILVRHNIRSVKDLACAEPEGLLEELMPEGPIRQVRMRRLPPDENVVTQWVHNAQMAEPGRGDGTRYETRYEIAR